MNHYMLDLETLGNGHNGAIVTLGIIAFDPAQGKVAEEGFYRRIELDCAHFGVVEESNRSWWDNQGSAERDEALGGGNGVRGIDSRCPLMEALRDLDLWLEYGGVDLGKDGPWRLWAKPPEFDCRLLREAYERCGLEFPFHFRATRDMRTLIEVAKSLGIDHDGSVVRTSMRHSALEDARWQARVVCNVYQLMRKRMG